jgi:hypothetical protein
MAESAKNKKPRTVAQAAANQRASAASKDAMAWMESHKAQGVEKSVLNSGVIQRMQKDGKGEEEILAAVLARQRERKEKKVAKPKANAAPSGNAGNAGTKKKNNNNARSTTTNGTAKNKKKPRSAAGVAANNALRALMAKFKTHKLKASNPARQYYKAQTLAGKNNDAIFAAMKNNPEFRENAPPVPRSKPRAQSSSAAAVPRNGVKGSYVCEKCQFVGTNAAVAKPVNNMSGNYFPVNASGSSNAGLVNL